VCPEVVGSDFKFTSTFKQKPPEHLASISKVLEVHFHGSIAPDWTIMSGFSSKCFDSQTGVAKRVAHTAFSHPPDSEGIDVKGRESIEIRTLVFG
jgi:hypothetical protein